MKSTQMISKLTLLHRPGFFGRRKPEIIADLNREHGENNWTLVWHDGIGDPEDPNAVLVEFFAACLLFYEQSYIQYFREHPEELDFICSFGEVIDNAMSNIESGCNYAQQETAATHIQDIAIRNVLELNGRWFEGPQDRILVVRSRDSEGYRFSPGVIPYHDKEHITMPSKCPKWAARFSLEDFWQSNKYIAVINA
jgi:hypothetical protein